MYIKYAYGPVTVGYQKSETDANTDVTVMNLMHTEFHIPYLMIYQLVTVSLLTMQETNLQMKNTQ